MFKVTTIKMLDSTSSAPAPKPFFHNSFKVAYKHYCKLVENLNLTNAELTDEFNSQRSAYAGGRGFDYAVMLQELQHYIALVPMGGDHAGKLGQHSTHAYSIEEAKKWAEVRFSKDRPMVVVQCDTDSLTTEDALTKYNAAK